MNITSIKILESELEKIQKEINLSTHIYYNNSFAGVSKKSLEYQKQKIKSLENQKQQLLKDIEFFSSGIKESSS